MRRTIAARLIEPSRPFRHFYLTADVTIERLIEVRQEATRRPRGRGRHPAFRLSLNDFSSRPGRSRSQRVPAPMRVGGRPDPTFPPFRHRHRGRDRGRPADAADPQADTKG